MERIVLSLVAALLVHTGLALAHPVSFKGGFGTMPEYSGDRVDLELNYSLTPTTALGLSTIHAESSHGSVSFVVPRFNHRLYRRNELESQTNLYVSGGIGGSMRGDASGIAGLIALQGDFETRRVYTLLNLEALPSSGGVDLTRVRYRAGFAPYLAGFDDLNTWIIFQVDHQTEMEDSWVFSPLLRFFYRNLLLEVGASLHGDPFIAGIFHF
jgi:hypothetical protein